MTWLRANWRPLLGATAGICLLGAIAFAASLRVALVDPRPSQLLLDRHQVYLGEVPGEHDHRGYWPLPAVLPERIVTATLETEDRHFFDHPGVYLPSVARALRQNVRELRIVSGASTVAMQLARLQRPPGRRSLYKKVRETAEALWLVHRHGHHAVLRQYLRLAPYGNRVRGAVYAARFYFDKPLEDLSWLQAAYLAALPQAPGRMNPFNAEGLRRGLARAERILFTLHRRGHIDVPALEQALASELHLVARPRRDPAALHAVLELSEQAARHPQRILRATLDLELQREVRGILARNLAALAHRGASNSAALVVDHRSGEVLASVGSVDYFAEDSRGAIDFSRTKRSPGSTLKPFIYALALDQHGYSAASELIDTPMDVLTQRGRAYLPRNIGGRFHGPMLLREALGNSRNIPALRMLSAIGVEPVLQLLERGGVQGIDYSPGAYGLGLALGNLHLSLAELVTLYTALARDGRSVPLRRLVDEQPRPGATLFGPVTAGLIRDILDDDEARVPSFSRGSALEFPYAVAAKTGTSQGYRDAWAVLVSDRLVVGVWTGNHDWRRMNRLGGLAGAADAAHAILELAMPRVDPHLAVAERFALPREAEPRTVCALSGKLAGPHCPSPRTEHFAPGSEPVLPCRYHREIQVDRRNGLLASAACPPRQVEQRALLDLPEHYQRWAREQHLELAPTRISPLCAPPPATTPRVAITAPRDLARFLWDPDTPADFSTVRLSAEVRPAGEEIVWIVDGVPLVQVGEPYEARLPLTPGTHQIHAALARRSGRSAPVTITVLD